MVSVNELLNSTIAGNIAQKLDAQDGKTDGQISKSIWNNFLQDNNISGNTVRESISTVSAMNSITTYAVRMCKNAGQSVDELANTWLAKLNIIDTKEIKEETPEETPEETVKKILDTNQINDIDDEMLKDIVSKYNLIKQINTNITNEELQSRISNYAKALKFHNVEMQANCGKDVEFESPCKASSVDELIEKYQQFGKEYVELYDQDGDGAIDVYELFYRELYEHYQVVDNMNERDAKLKAIRVAEQYNNCYNMSNLPTDETDEAELFRMVANKIGVIDSTNNSTQDLKVSSKEAAAHLMSMAQLCDDKNNIIKSEFNGAELAIQFNNPDYKTPGDYDAHKDEIINEIKMSLKCDDNFANTIFGYVKKYNTNIQEYMRYYNK